MTNSANKDFFETMRIAVTGTTGRVGAALANHLTTTHEVIPLPRSLCDLESSESLAAALDKLDCEIFLNPAGLTSLEACEDDPALAHRLNAEAPGEIATWAASRGVKVFHFSTDYVFSGEVSGLHDESEIPQPLSAYGRSKLAGENAVLAWPANCVIRISWVYGPEKFSFVDRVFEDAMAGQPLAAIADKFSLPVFTTDLAVWTEQLVEKNVSGIYHACNSGTPITWHDMAKAVIKEMHACGVIPELPTINREKLSEKSSFRAARPRHSAMNTRRLTEILGTTPRSWDVAISEYIRSRCALL